MQPCMHWMTWFKPIGMTAVCHAVLWWSLHCLVSHHGPHYVFALLLVLAQLPEFVAAAHPMKPCAQHISAHQPYQAPWHVAIFQSSGDHTVPCCGWSH